MKCRLSGKRSLFSTFFLFESFPHLHGRERGMHTYYQVSQVMSISVSNEDELCKQPLRRATTPDTCYIYVSLSPSCLPCLGLKQCERHVSSEIL